MVRTPMSARLVAVVITVSALYACGEDRQPTAPSATPTSPVATAPTPTSPTPITSFTGDVSGTWVGEYAITGCAPINAPNRCTTYIPLGPQSMTLTLTQSGSNLSGMFTSDLLGPLAVAGSVDTAGALRLSGARASQFKCFETSVRAIEIGDWTTQITKTGEFHGTFRQSSEQILSSCYTGRYDYYSQVLSLRRSGTSAPPLPPVAAGTRVSGRILDFFSGAPAAGVDVTWHGRTSDYGVVGAVRMVSDQQGQYSVVLPPSAYYALTFDDPTNGSGVVRVPGTTYQTDLFISPTACNWVRYGTVLDAGTRRPVVGARVTASGTASITREDGSYALDRNCGSNGGGQINLVATHPGYVTQGEFASRAEAFRGIRRVDFALSPQR